MTNVTIYLPSEVLARCRAAAAEDNRSLSNYLAGLLERAHPPSSASRQVDIEDAIARTVKRGMAPPVADAVATLKRLKPKHK